MVCGATTFRSWTCNVTPGRNTMPQVEDQTLRPGSTVDYMVQHAGLKGTLLDHRYLHFKRITKASSQTRRNVTSTPWACTEADCPLKYHCPQRLYPGGQHLRRSGFRGGPGNPVVMNRVLGLRIRYSVTHLYATAWATPSRISVYSKLAEKLGVGSNRYAHANMGSTKPARSGSV